LKRGIPQDLCKESKIVGTKSISVNDPEGPENYNNTGIKYGTT
jgi:hypothetical protein